MFTAAAGQALFGKIAMSIFNKRKEKKGPAFSQMKTPQVSVTSRISDVSRQRKSKPPRASQSTIPINKARVGNVSGKGFKMKAVSGLTG